MSHGNTRYRCKLSLIDSLVFCAAQKVSAMCFPSVLLLHASIVGHFLHAFHRDLQRDRECVFCAEFCARITHKDGCVFLTKREQSHGDHCKKTFSGEAQSLKGELTECCKLSTPQCWCTRSVSVSDENRQKREKHPTLCRNVVWTVFGIRMTFYSLPNICAKNKLKMACSIYLDPSVYKTWSGAKIQFLCARRLSPPVETTQICLRWGEWGGRGV